MPCWVGSRVGWVVGSGVRWLRCVLGCWVVGSGDGLGVGVLGCRCVGSGVGLGDWFSWALGCSVASRLGE